MKFKIGDKVRVKSLKEIEAMSGKMEDSWVTMYKNSNGDLEEGYFSNEMTCFCENEYVICDIDKGGDSIYYFQGDSHSYYFLEDWLEPIEEKPIFVNSFDGEDEDKASKLQTILEQIETLAAEARKLVKGEQDENLQSDL